MSIWQELALLQQNQINCALCTVIKTSGSTPRKVGSKMIVVKNNNSHGDIIGTIGGGAIEHHIRKLAIESIINQTPTVVDTSLRNELGMCCGGDMSVFIEPIIHNNQIFCFGAGHINQALCNIINKLNFDVIIIDSRQELLNNKIFDNTKKIYHHAPETCLDILNLNHNSYVLVATHDHALDQKLIEEILKFPIKYLALVGSARKNLFTKKRLTAKNFSPDLINQVICPAGLDISAQTPEEIAIAILAQIIQIKNHEHQHRRRDRRSRPEPAYGTTQSFD